MKSFVSLWNKQSFNFSSDFHDGNFKSFSMLVTEPGSLLYWCLMKRADLLCTISIFLIWFSWSNLICSCRLDLTQSVHDKICIGMHRGVKF
jgi:hypothetical protein